MVGGQTIDYRPPTSGFQPPLTNVASNGPPPTRHREHDHHAGDKRGRAESILFFDDDDIEDEAASGLKDMSEPARASKKARLSDSSVVQYAALPSRRECAH